MATRATIAKITAGVLVLVVLGGAVWAWRGSGEAPPTYELVAVSKGNIASRVTASGTLSPLISVEVGSQVSGRISEILADFNAEVSAGQVIARLDTEALQSDVASASANLESARAGLTSAQITLEDAQREQARAETLAASGAQSDADLQTARSDARRAAAALTVAQATVAQRRAALAQMLTSLSNATIVSPIDGVVISRAVDVGQTVAASLSAPTLFTIAGDLRQMEIHTSVAESDVGVVVAGMTARFSVDAWPSDHFEGKVREVRYSPTTVQNVVTYDAVVTVENPDLKLRPGMTAEVTFVVEERSDALIVPSAALRFQPIGATPGVAPAAAAGGGRGRGGGASGGGGASASAKQRTLFRLGADGDPEPVPVTIGISDGRNTEIVEGVAEGDQIISGQTGGATDPNATKKPSYGRLL